MNEWISVKDRLPDKHYEDVLVWDEMDACCFIALLRYDGKWCVPGFTHHRFEITHWMPLPAPPKGEENND